MDITIFGGRNPQTVVAVLREQKSASGEKLFYPSYPKQFDTFSDIQKDRTYKFVFNLTKEVRDAVFQRVDDLLARHEVHENERVQMTTKDDLARILHMRRDPQLTVLWTSAFTPLDRLQLDAKSSGEEAFDDPWSLLAEAFNDYERNHYDNAATGVAGFEAVAERCGDINPSNANRPARNGVWFKEKWSKLRTDLSKTFAKFMQSGNQDLEDKVSEWAKFAQDDVELYSICIFSLGDHGDYAKLGKLLAPRIQQDTGLLEETHVDSNAVVPENIAAAKTYSTTKEAE